MSNSGDKRPLAPPRSLETGPDTPAAQETPAAVGAGRSDASGSGSSVASAGSGSHGVAASAYAVTDRPTAVTPEQKTDDGGLAGSTQTGPMVDKKAERRAEQAARRAQARQPRRVRRAKLRVVRLDPWSVTKASFLLSIAFGIMCVVAVFLVFSIMNAAGLWDNVNSTIQGVIKNKPEDAFDIKDYVGMSRIMGITMLISAIDVVIITALATLGAFIYNMAASLLGGIEVTLAEDLK